VKRLQQQLGARYYEKTSFGRRLVGSDGSDQRRKCSSQLAVLTIGLPIPAVVDALEAAA
jgi:hypothetical protein